MSAVINPLFCALAQDGHHSPINTYVSIKGETRRLGLLHPHIKVHLVDKLTGRTWITDSDSGGRYQFNGVGKKSKYYIFAFDQLGNFNAVIQDNVVPK